MQTIIVQWKIVTPKDIRFRETERRGPPTATFCCMTTGRCWYCCCGYWGGGGYWGGWPWYG